MKIAIVGTGTMAGGFARGLKDKHEVWLGSRDIGGLGLGPDSPLKVLQHS
jgi:hypothetical protein